MHSLRPRTRLLLVVFAGVVFLLLIALLLRPPATFADSAQTIAVEQTSDFTSFLLHSTAMLHATQANPEEGRRLFLPAAATHLWMQYSSPHPVPLLLWFADDTKKRPDQTEAISTTLPPGQHKAVRLSLRASPGWRPGRKGIVVEFHTLAKEPYRLENIALEQNSDAFETVRSFLLQPWRADWFGAFSINLLYGYKMGGWSLTFLMGAMMMLFAGVMILILCFRQAVRVLALTAAVGIGLYQIRFLADALPATASELTEWNTKGTYRSIGGDLYLAAEALKKEIAAAGHRPTASVCSTAPGLHKDALHYLVPGADIDVSAKNWMQAAYGLVLFQHWEQNGSDIYCDGQTREGTVLQAFPNGGALIRFTP